ncbi:MAG TPA: hypothetical protein VKN18_00540 [Blastocatellia bacterium]|nr:hypothetical protein [Blastocatellia bacterium]
MYFEKVVQPGQVGTILVRLHTADHTGPLEASYELQTNDPKHPIIKVSIIANVKPLPAYVKRIRTADVAHGEPVGAFHVWPTARPAITVEPGEKASIALRIRALTPDAGTLKLSPDAPGSWKLRREANGDYWLDIGLEGAASASRAAQLIVEGSPSPQQIRIQLMVAVPAENLTVTPKELDFGEQNLTSLGSAIQRFGIRKQVGSFHIKNLSSTLSFLKFQQSTMVEGSNYLIRITVDATKPIKAGAFEGMVIVETDDGNKVELPVKIKFVQP